MRDVVTNNKLEAVGIAPLQRRKNLPKTPEAPCDVCGEMSKTRCSACYTKFYCSKACQKIDWKECGHKAECTTIRTKLDRDAAHVLDMLRPQEGVLDDYADPETCYRRVRWASDNLLDNETAYSKAVNNGLHDALRRFLTEDLHNMEARWAHDVPCSWTSLSVNSLFKKRGGSRAGQRVTGGVDGSRCARYISSHPDAWTAWLAASAELARVPFRPAVAWNGPLVPHAQRAARDAWALMLLALIQRETAEAVLIEGGHGASTAETLRGAMEEIEGRWQGEDSPDPNGTIAGMIAIVMGMVHFWYDLFVKEDMLEGGDIRGWNFPAHSAEKYEYDVTFKRAEATIKKGKSLDTSEWNTIKNEVIAARNFKSSGDAGLCAPV